MDGLFLIAVVLHLCVMANSIYVSDVLKSYDYVIVGGGTSGAVLANRLSSDPSTQVLLLEAGSVPNEVSNIPFFVLSLINSEIDWAYKSVPQKYSCHGLKKYVFMEKMEKCPYQKQTIIPH